MDKNAAKLFSLGLFMANKAATERHHREFVSNLQQSDIAERIARDLWHVNCLQLGVPVEAWGDLHEITRRRFRERAEKIIRALGSSVEITAKTDAVRDTIDWAENKLFYNGEQASAEEIARYAIDEYRGRL